MPLVRAAAVVEVAAEPGGFADYIARLGSEDAGARRRAAGDLGRHAAAGGAEAAIGALAGRLPVERDADVREAIFVALGRIGGAAVAARVAPLLALDDAALRNGAVETLKRLGADAVAAVDCLVADDGADVRLLAVEVMRLWPPPLALPRLTALLGRECEVNVMGAALDVAAAAGDASLLPVLNAARARFGAEGFIGFAIAMAMKTLAARLGGT